VKRLILTAAIAFAIGLPSIAVAQTSGPMVCRAAKSGETANATMGTSQLVCHPVDMAKVQAAEKTLMSMMMPKSSMTSGQMSHMKSAELTINQELGIPMIPGASGTAQ